MKELSIEEKAKRYDEAIKVADSIHRFSSNPAEIKRMEEIFPELKESEDEKIRKAIKKALQVRCDGSRIISDEPVTLEEAIAWLEKQSKQTSWKPSKEEMDALYGLAYITNKMDDKKDEAITKLYQDLKREFFNGSSYENMFSNTEDGVRRRSTIQVLEYARSLDTYNQYGKADIDKNIAWLEKQGEQNRYTPVFTFEDVLALQCAMANAKDSDEKLYHALQSLHDRVHDSYSDEKQGEQKPADKVEPKFKVGDWIVYNDNVYQIHNISLKKYYECLRIDGTVHTFDFEYIDSKSRLWTIHDAKDGDVLVDKYGNIGIYQGDKNAVTWHSYCYCCVNKGFYDEGSHEFPCYPATKEQRDQLEKAMANAGYTFDFEKKELKKIEQKLATMSLDEAIEHCKEKSCGNNACALERKQLEKWLTELKELKEQKSAWSEEDEKMIDAALQFAHEYGRHGLWCWLKSLKDRVLSQPKQEWSEEDERNLQGVIDEIQANKNNAPDYDLETYDRFLNWLKSLRPQNRWKPNEEQMAALYEETQKSNRIKDDRIVSLYNDLKKLMEE